MHFLNSLSLVSSLIALGSAVPTLNGRSTNFCPGQSHLTSEVKCSSGFIGCVAYEKGSEICNGPKRFYNDCSGAAGLGSFFNCANGFKGCTTNPRICDTESPIPAPVPAPAPESCSAGSQWYVCASNGFAGCSNDPHVCDPPKPATGDCPKDSSYYVCANGFKGCSNDPHVCDPTPNPEPPVDNCPADSKYYVCASNGFRGCSSNPKICDPVVNSPDTVVDAPVTPTCPEDTWYVRPQECTSGFVGCTGSQLGSITEICGGEKRFWGSCPAKHGNYYNCANGFVGCTTDVGVCDKKKQ